MSDIPSYTVTGLSNKTLQVHPDIIAQVFNIEPDVLQLAEITRFDQLPALIAKELHNARRNYSVIHIYTLSFEGLINAFLNHKNETLGFISFEGSIRYLANNVTLGELRSIYNLSQVDFDSTSITIFALQNTGASIKELALAEDMTVEQEIILNSLSFGDVKAILHLNQVMFDAMTMMDLGQRLLATISPLFGSKLSDIAGQCSVSPSEYKNVTLETLIERCLNVSLPILTKLPQTRVLGPILQVFTVMDITRTLNITVDTIFQYNITHIARLLGVRYQKLVREAELPVVLLADRMGISFTALPTYKIATLASALLGLQFDIIQKVYQIPPQQLSASSSITFNHLPMLVYQEVGKNYSVRHLYTMSFAGLVQAFFVHQNATLGFMSYEKSIGFMATKVKLLELRNLYSLNLSNFLALSIPSFALQYTGASIKELALAEDMTTEQEIILNSLSFGDVKAILHLNQVMFDAMTMMGLGQRLLATISPLFASKLSSIAGQCSVSPSEYKNVTLETLIERCLNVSLPILTKLPQTRALGPILQVFTVMDITRTLNITVDTIFQYNITHIARLLGVRYQKLVREAELPVVLLADRMGISFTALPTYKIATLASALLGLQFDILQKVYQIPPQQLSASSSITFNHLPMLVYQEVGKNYSVRHLYTMSFAGLVQAFFVHQNATLGFMSYEKSIGFMATKVKLLELRNLYSLNLSNFLALSIPSFALQYTGASIKELALAEDMTTEQEIILNSLSFGDVKAILHLNQVMFDAMTMMDLGQRLLATISPLFASKLSSIAGQCSVSPSEHKNVTLETLIERCLNVSLPILTKLPQTRALGPILQVFTVMDITRTLNITVDTIFQYNITHIARLLGVRYQKLVREAELPVVLLADRMGISFTALPTYKIATLASALLGLQFDIIQKVYQIPPQQLSASSSITFNHLPMLVYQEVGKNYSVRHLYTMSFAGLVQAFFVHQNATLGFMSYEKSIGFMATKVKLLELRNLYSLNLSNFLALSIPSFALQYTGASIKELALAEDMTTEQEIILNSLSFGDVKAILHLNQVMFDAMTMMGLGQRLLATISPLFASKLSSIAGQCSVSPSEYKNVTLETLIERCLNVSLPILTKLPQTRALGPILQVFTVMDITRTLNITVDTIFQYNITHIARLLGVRYQKLVREAELPVVLLADRMGISFTALPTYKIATLASALLGLQFDILQKVYQIPPQQLSASSSITFNHLPMLVYQEVGKNYSVRHLYTMSFAGLVQAFFVHQNATLGFMSYEKSIGFMATKVKLLELRNLYSLNLSNFLALSIPSFALQYTGASIKELALAEDMTTEQEIILNSLSFGDVKAILHLNQVMFDAMTMMDLGQKLLATISPLFGSKLSSIAGQCSVSPSEYKNVTLERLIERCLNVSLLILTKLPQTRALGPILQVFTVMDITRTLNITVDTIFQYNITHIARLLGRRLQVLQNDVSNVPIVVIAYRSKIAYEAIPQKTTLGLLEEVTGLTEPLLVKVFNVSLSKVPMLKALKFGQIPATVKALNITGVELVVSHFYTMSFIDLIFPVLIRRSASEAAKAIEKGITYLAVRMKLSEIQQIYKIQNLDFLEHSFHTLTAKYAAVTGKDIAKALNLTLEQEHLLTYVRFGDAQIYLKLGRSLYMHTSNDLGKKLLAMGRETVGLFTPFKVTKPSDLESVSLIQYLLTTGLKQVNINSVLSNLGVTDDLQIVFSHYEVADFAEPLKIITSQMAKMPPFQIMRKIVSFFSTGKFSVITITIILLIFLALCMIKIFIGGGGGQGW